jgi:hypothetical protein
VPAELLTVALKDRVWLIGLKVVETLEVAVEVDAALTVREWLESVETL